MQFDSFLLGTVRCREIMHWNGSNQELLFNFITVYEKERFLDRTQGLFSFQFFFVSYSKKTCLTHGVLNIDEKKTNCIVLGKIARRIF